MSRYKTREEYLTAKEKFEEMIKRPRDSVRDSARDSYDRDGEEIADICVRCYKYSGRSINRDTIPDDRICTCDDEEAEPGEDLAGVDFWTKTAAGNTAPSPADPAAAAGPVPPTDQEREKAAEERLSRADQRFAEWLVNFSPPPFGPGSRISEMLTRILAGFEKDLGLEQPFIVSSGMLPNPLGMISLRRLWEDYNNILREIGVSAPPGLFFPAPDSFPASASAVLTPEAAAAPISHAPPLPSEAPPVKKADKFRISGHVRVNSNCSSVLLGSCGYVKGITENGNYEVYMHSKPYSGSVLVFSPHELDRI